MAGSRNHRVDDRIRGRGAQSGAVSHRFGLPAREEDGDWRDSRTDIDGAPPPMRTSVTEEFPKTSLSVNRAPELGLVRLGNADRGGQPGSDDCFGRPAPA